MIMLLYTQPFWHISADPCFGGGVRNSVATVSADVFLWLLIVWRLSCGCCILWLLYRPTFLFRSGGVAFLCISRRVAAVSADVFLCISRRVAAVSADVFSQPLRRAWYIARSGFRDHAAKLVYRVQPTYSWSANIKEGAFAL